VEEEIRRRVWAVILKEAPVSYKDRMPVRKKKDVHRVVGSLVSKVLKERNAFICKVRHAKRHIHTGCSLFFLDRLTFEDEGTTIF